jgi:rhodanese-related sulfurtransferase
MGASQSIQKINFEDMQTVVKCPETYLLINTLPVFEQDCLITSSVPGSKEEEIINQLLKSNKNVKIIVYGRNANDDTVYKKYTQLTNLGFYNVFVYVGGLFEWLLLQDIYSTDLFGTTTVAKDLLKYKSPPKLNISLLEY